MLNSVMIEEERQFLIDEKKTYLAKIKTTPEERGKVRSWVNKGNSVYSNPWLLYSESGYQMDYIRALRVVAEMDESFEAYNSCQSVMEDGSITVLPF